VDNLSNISAKDISKTGTQNNVV